MDRKFPTWTRKRFGGNRVHWVAYDDRAGVGDRSIIDQGYATTLAGADAAARAALAEAGLYGGRRTATGAASSGRAPVPEGPRRAGQAIGRVPLGPRRYLYTRQQSEDDDGIHVRAHLVLRSTPKKVYVTPRSYWIGQLGTEDESWEPGERSIALDRVKLDRDGSVYSARFRHSGFYGSHEEAKGESAGLEDLASGVLGLQTPCSLEDIKAAYRRRALEVHPDRGGAPGDFQAVEDAYRKLVRAARVQP